MTRKVQAKKKPGPKADRVAIDGNWQEAVEKAVSIEKPPGGWPKPKKRDAGGKRKRTPKK